MATFTQDQINYLLIGIKPDRIETRRQAGMSLSYLSQHDVRAHLIRVFGFGNFDLTTEEARLAFEHEHDNKWSVGYQVTMCLTIRNPEGTFVCQFSETAVGTSTQGRRGEAHDMAMKTASSDAMKRCAINLGDQFGLSLYQNGQTAPIVRGTLVNAPTQPVKATHSDEQPDQADQATPDTPTPQDSPEGVEAAAYLSTLVDLPVRERITEVAKFKTAQPHVLAHTVTIGEGQAMTVARYADLVAAGKYSEGDTA